MGLEGEAGGCGQSEASPSHLSLLQIIRPGARRCGAVGLACCIKEEVAELPVFLLTCLGCCAQLRPDSAPPLVALCL